MIEENAEGDIKALEWLILTTKVVKTAVEAEDCIKWYCLRWRIEDWHRVIKSGAVPLFPKINIFRVFK